MLNATVPFWRRCDTLCTSCPISILSQRMMSLHRIAKHRLCAPNASYRYLVFQSYTLAVTESGRHAKCTGSLQRITVLIIRVTVHCLHTKVVELYYNFFFQKELGVCMYNVHTLPCRLYMYFYYILHLSTTWSSTTYFKIKRLLQASTVADQFTWHLHRVLGNKPAVDRHRHCQHSWRILVQFATLSTHLCLAQLTSDNLRRRLAYRGEFPKTRVLPAPQGSTLNCADTRISL